MCLWQKHSETLVIGAREEYAMNMQGRKVYKKARVSNLMTLFKNY